MTAFIGRREFITLLGGAAAAWPLAARAQQAGKIHKIGYLSPDSPSAVITPFLDALRELGWIEGQNVTFEYRYAENRLERLPELAAELWFASTSTSSWHAERSGRSRPSKPVPPFRSS